MIFIGVNDVWHKRTSGTGTDADKFEKFYTAIIKKLQARNIKVVLCTPAAIGKKPILAMNSTATSTNTATSFARWPSRTVCRSWIYVNHFLEYNKQYNTENKESGILTSDRVHLNEKGINL